MRPQDMGNFEEMAQKAEKELKRNISRVRLRNAGYVLLALGIIGLMVAVGLQFWTAYKTDLSFWAAVSAVVSAGLLGYWLWLDRSDDMLNCPVWLQWSIIGAGWASLLLFIAAFFI